MKWRKLGHLFSPDGTRPWMRSHAANPVAEMRGGDLCRVYFSTRDAANRSSVAWIEFDLHDPSRILRVAGAPVLVPGPRGAFDDSGCSIGCLLQREGRRWLYYMGWNLGITVPWRNAIGLAVEEDGEFRRVSDAPVLDRGRADPFTLSYPWVLEEPDGGLSMWYGSNLAWGAGHADMDHVIKGARSRDGLEWERDGATLVGPLHEGEYAFARPCVVRDGALLRMWYAYRGEAYRIGYAECIDGRRWERRDEEVGIDVSPGGAWDSESIEYPCVFDHRGERYMIYCGNGYGRTGFGLAILEAA